MKAMRLHAITDMTVNDEPLVMEELPIPVPKEDEVLLKISACGVCHTELDEIEGRTPPPVFPVTPGHQVIGRIEERGADAKKYHINDRVGVAWIFSSCGKCRYCLSGNENLCTEYTATGRDADGGYAEYMVVKENFVHPVPAVFSDEEAAPLLCAGAIGYRSLRLAGFDFFSSSTLAGAWGPGQNSTGTGQIETLGLTGFGASAHLVLKMVRHRFPLVKIFVFARNETERSFARELGAVWTGDTMEAPPERLDAIIDTTPVWKTMVQALLHLKPGGRLIINAIRKESRDKDYLLNLDYPSHLWMEKEIKSVANVALRDVREFLFLAAEIPIRPELQIYPLEQANKALTELKQQKIRGAKVLKTG
jgi:alcohol dehydrogenase, propanol-preferring